MVWHIIVSSLFFQSHLVAKLPLTIFDCTLSGYIKSELYTDSRRTKSDEEFEISYFPTQQIDDPDGHDINARGSTRMDAFETRISADFYNIKMRDADISAKVEVDFEVFAKEITNIPHLRHAYGQLDWQNFSFLFGQTWHPVTLAETKTINYNGNSPFDFYSRAPQFACTYRSSENFKITFTATSETDFVSDGPYGFDTDYIRWAVVPNFNIKTQWKINKHTMALSADYKRLAPRIESDTDYKVHERLSSFAIIWYMQFKWPSIRVNTKINWGQNATDYGGIGGYAVVQGSTNPISHKRTYTNISNIAWWLDFEIAKNPWCKPGIFIGFAQNLGSTKKIDFDRIDPDMGLIERNIFAFVPDVNNVFRISPRITSEFYNHLRFAGEIEYTRANYGTITRYAQVINTKPAELVRCTFAAYYFF